MCACRYALAALLALTPAVALAQDAASAGRFVRGLYSAYHGSGPDYLGGQAKDVFAPPLLKLIRRDAAQTPPGDVPALDGDPICDCQDFDGIRDVDARIIGGAGGRASATVQFWISNDPRTVRLDLVAVHGHWRVSDVHTAETPSLIAFLRQSLSTPKSRK
jgi:hypothetical protein